MEKNNEALKSIRQAVRAVPTYPFVPSEVPHKLDQNENPDDFPPALKQKALERMLSYEWNRYPELHADKLRGLIAEYENWDPKGVVLTAGSNLLIKLLLELAGIGQTLISSTPTFPVYSLEALMLDTKLRQVPLNKDFSLPVEELKAEIEAATQAGESGIFYLIQPHAPTGYLDPQAAVQELVEYADERGWIVILDEAYYQYSKTDYRQLVKGHARRLSMRTFSKAWGLAGMRLGYILTSPELAQNVLKLVPAFNISLVTQAVIEEALENDSYMHENVNRAISERDRVLEALQTHPTCKAYHTHTNFFLLRAPDAQSAYVHLLQHGIITRSQDKLPGLEGCLRIGLGNRADNDALLAALASYEG